MAEDKANTVSVRIFQETQDALLGEQLRIKRTGRPKPSIAELIQTAWERSSESSTQTSDKSEGLPPSGAGSKSGIYNSGKSTSMDSPRPFFERLSVLLESVPQGSLPVVEECLLQIVQLATGPFGVKTDEQGAANTHGSTKSFKRLKKLHDKPGNVEDISGEPA